MDKKFFTDCAKDIVNRLKDPAHDQEWDGLTSDLITIGAAGAGALLGAGRGIVDVVTTHSNFYKGVGKIAATTIKGGVVVGIAVRSLQAADAFFRRDIPHRNRELTKRKNSVQPNPPSG